jgi:hypothetical protein
MRITPSPIPLVLTTVLLLAIPAIAREPAAANPVSDVDGCGDAGPGGASQDVADLSATYDADTDRIAVRMQLCGPVDDGTKYQVLFDAFPPVAWDNPHCLETSDASINFKPGREVPVTGPGSVRVETGDSGPATLVFEMDTWNLALVPGDRVGIWSRVHRRNAGDRAPDTDGTDDCGEPQVAEEVLLLALEPLQQPLIDCTSVPPEGGDLDDRGFYVDGYPGTTLDRVDLWFTTWAPGTYTLRLTAREDAYDGPLVGTATGDFQLPLGPPTELASFRFDSPPVTPGSILTFKIEVLAGPAGSVYYAVNCGVDATCAASCPVVQTEGSTPPLDERRRHGINVRIFGSP